VQTTGYHRKYAILVLSRKRVRKTQPAQRPRTSVYTAEDARALEKVSDLFEGINAKLLRVALDNELKHLYDSGFLAISQACYTRLKHISPATIDRLRQRYGRGLPPRVKRGHTKPGTLLKSQIRVRTWAEWDEDRPGFTEMDLVAHDGGDGSGDFAHALDVTDIKTGWTECAAARNKAQIHVFAALKQIRARLPFPLLGIDSDNGAEFINDELLRYANQEHLTFTRSRPGRKNDGAHVEQKNWSVVRRYVGDLRYDTPAQVALLNQFYEVLHLYVNFFLPVVKLKEKVRTAIRSLKSTTRRKHRINGSWRVPRFPLKSKPNCARNMRNSTWSPSTSKSSAWSNNSGRVGDDWPDHPRAGASRQPPDHSRLRLIHVTSAWIEFGPVIPATFLHEEPNLAW
jgi:hypothetical protein